MNNNDTLRSAKMKNEESSRVQLFQFDAAQKLDETFYRRDQGWFTGLATATGNCGGSEPVGGARRRVQEILYLNNRADIIANGKRKQ